MGPRSQNLIPVYYSVSFLKGFPPLHICSFLKSELTKRGIATAAILIKIQVCLCPVYVLFVTVQT